MRRNTLYSLPFVCCVTEMEKVTSYLFPFPSPEINLPLFPKVVILARFDSRSRKRKRVANIYRHIQYLLSPYLGMARPPHEMERLTLLLFTLALEPMNGFVLPNSHQMNKDWNTSFCGAPSRETPTDGRASSSILHHSLVLRRRESSPFSIPGPFALHQSRLPFPLSPISLFSPPWRRSFLGQLEPLFPPCHHKNSTLSFQTF